MRNTTFRPLRAAGATIAAFGLILGLGACSSEPDAEQFCSEAKTVIEGEMPEKPEDAEAFAKKVKKIKAPKEIKGDWAVVQDLAGDLADLASKMDADNPEKSVAAQEKLLEKVESDKAQNAQKSIDEYMEKNCEK